MFVLDALNYASDWLDGSLAFRWSCRMGVCGSCGALVDGTPRLTCAAPIPETGEKVVIEPLHRFGSIVQFRNDVIESADALQDCNRFALGRRIGKRRT